MLAIERSSNLTGRQQVLSMPREFILGSLEVACDFQMAQCKLCVDETGLVMHFCNRI
jgi:hypothetical protein